MATGEKNDYVRAGQIGLLFVEPRQPPSPQPVLDALTQQMTAALRVATNPDWAYRGFHVCSCGAPSSNKDFIIGNLVTNSLCVHYLAFHRDEIPARELAKVATLAHGHATPTDDELLPPAKEKARRARLASVAAGRRSLSFQGTYADFLNRNGS